MASKTVLQLEFMTDLNQRVRLNLPNPKQPVDNQAVQQAMDLVVSKNIFAFPQGQVVKKVGATLVQTDSTSLA